MSPPSSVSKIGKARNHHEAGNKFCSVRKQYVYGTSLLSASCSILLGLFFDTEDGGDMFLRNAG
jgi:hypothetical protein